MNAQISVSIVTFYTERTAKLIKKINVLKNLLIELSENYLVQNIFISDNSLDSKFVAQFKSIPKVIYVHNKSNYGYAKGHNISRDYLKYLKYHLIINPDIIFAKQTSENVLSRLISFMEKDTDVHMIQPLICDEGSEKIQYLCKRNPTLFIQFLRGFSNPKILNFFKKYNHWYEMRESAYKNKPVESTYLSGSFMLCRRKYLDINNWMDSRYFMYLEDADLTRSFNKFGKCIHYPLVKVEHLWEKGSKKYLFLKIHAIRSFIFYSLKWGLKII
ncbi:glycosyltransferase family 2 protein [Prochlorococcus marinus]|uniref:glycosyltransferase family 2 protein n=1 Tax=Prochlorococcus marinus TaxID=1219 RepID=UPI001AD9C61D|nr:glycosyltransferase family 2 protein [Prochlorococcus marinus]MBO8217690.1 glycosyltransferase family 2 protein [Prochlorococcus marinus XMU1405]MBW3040853.1 dTDP-Rha--alpha-D-GlcNAc-pyrophosphate polyprenol alpha-3-L-rhamnosyltransferase [Prochlorococcus marinus str. MU1405]MBW3048313.1 dTDP-Rha--alpha-D-GlcNAc-pyrophosphate polyprenol alpha-3-L-rhamnosyltransferase [Prochlorococcus marinus str. MU1406]